MKQRVVVLIATYLEHRVRGRITRIRPCGDDDYIVGVEDVRDGRTHLLHSIDDLREWLMSFKTGECLQPAAAICGICDRLHIDRDLDGEPMRNCVGCSLELIEIYTDLHNRRSD